MLNRDRRGSGAAGSGRGPLLMASVEYCVRPHRVRQARRLRAHSRCGCVDGCVIAPGAALSRALLMRGDVCFAEHDACPSACAAAIWSPWGTLGRTRASVRPSLRRSRANSSTASWRSLLCAGRAPRSRYESGRRARASAAPSPRLLVTPSQICRTGLLSSTR